jgi:hypothetical protein
MKRLGFLFFAWCLLASLLAARSEAAPACPDPKYKPLSLAADEVASGGIGGTGRSADPGTGGIGGTGIVGTITGFASICVNGLEVHYERSVPVSENGRPVDSQQLAIGQLVVVEAVDSQRGLEAARVGIVYQLEGPVTRVGKGGPLEVMGAPVLTSDLVGNLPRLRVGDWVQVSGHADAQGRVFASRIAAIKPQADATVVGEARPASRRVGAVMIDQRQEGEVMVRGRWDGYRLRVSEARQAPTVDWRAQPDRLVVETRVREVDAGRVRTDRAEIDAMLSGHNANLKPGDVVRVSSRRDGDGQLRPEKLERAERGLRSSLERTEKPLATGAQATPGEKPERRAPPGHDDRSPRSGREDRGEKQERSERRERPDRREVRERRERQERIERTEEPARVNRDR